MNGTILLTTPIDPVRAGSMGVDLIEKHDYIHSVVTNGGENVINGAAAKGGSIPMGYDGLKRGVQAKSIRWAATESVPQAGCP